MLRCVIVCITSTAQGVCVSNTKLVGKQWLDGGWGESYLSCQDKVRFTT
jgi:hypothetical protein